MTQWWDGLSLISQVFALIAIPSTLILLIQTVLLFFGIGNDDSDFDSVDSDVDFDIDDVSDGSLIDSHADGGNSGFALFSIRGIVAMLCIGGWSGLVMLEAGLPEILSVILALNFGMLALFGIAYLMKIAMKLQSSGNIDLGNAIGKTGCVYIPIPPQATGRGKINVVVQDKYIEVEAVTTSARKLATGESVRIVSTDETGLLVVEPLID